MSAPVGASRHLFSAKVFGWRRGESSKAVLYLAGPRPGGDEAFDLARDELLDEGYMVISPVDLARKNLSISEEWLSRYAMDALLWVDQVITLGGWETCDHAQFEITLAARIDIEVIRFADREPEDVAAWLVALPRELVAEEAA
ncbi:MAG: DUF4406 domain-containing protein [Actinomycetota bacterium]